MLIRFKYYYFCVMRRVISLLVLLVATWQIVGFFSYFEWEKFQIRREIKEVIAQTSSKKELCELEFTFKEMKNLTWFESREFKFQGRMYDVVKRIPTKNGVHFICINDSKEASLYAKLDQATFANMNSSSQNSPLKHWLKVLKTPFTSDFYPANFTLSTVIKAEKTIYYFKQENCLLVSIDSSSPPPKIAII
ncbi:MAG: hypothetical protein EBU01_06455 [Crocinitomicaceae bacterium]|nr:hypothetical protein [Crocinitomicaceae bacterium]NCA21307.1 hypothetical protein [Crocinitomicaceae bacterium]